MQYTGNYNLRKPDLTDPTLIEDLNYNAGVIDDKLGEVSETVNNIVENGTIRLVQTYDLTYNSTAKSPVYVPTLSAKARGFVVKAKNFNLNASMSNLYFGLISSAFTTNYNNHYANVQLNSLLTIEDEIIAVGMFCSSDQRVLFSNPTSSTMRTLLYGSGSPCMGVIHTTSGTTEYSSKVNGTVTVEFYEVL